MSDNLDMTPQLTLTPEADTSFKVKIKSWYL